ncbi:MAG: protein kinase [Gemmatimonadetes bacterium]|nr:protein kinase [Gemmatimonadota bacterium]
MTDIASRLSAALADRYTIQEELGAGGMATVYLAEDLKHHRKVAVKVLRPELAAILGAERFLKEIEVTASLQHPHILPLHDSGEADSFLYYVMPYVEGESLRDKLNRDKQLGIDETVEIAKGVAAALDYAHRQGVIHRDIKPENILIHDGQPVVADFGIALAVTTAGGTRLTETGLSLGTPQYMSPEQATGEREVTAKSDVYSLGAVVYEMLVGDPPHTGSTVQAIIAKVVSVEPTPITDVRHTAPRNVDAAVQKALAKVPADRFARATEFAEALTNPAFTLPTTRSSLQAAPEVSAGAAWQALRKWLVVVASLLLVVAAVFGWALRPILKPVARLGDVSSFIVPVAGGHRMLGGLYASLTLSPDGRTLVYGAQGRLHVRPLARFESEPLAGTEGASVPFFSPDGQWIGFLQGGTLRKVSVHGGPVTEIANAPISFGASWGEDGKIVYASALGGLWRVPAAGGVPEPVTTVLDTALETGHAWPQLLAGGRLVLFTAIGPSALWEDAKIVLQDLETGERKTVVERGTYGRYVPTGHIVYAQATGTLLAVPFDLARREVTGAPFPVESGVRVAWFGGAASFAVSDGGTAAFVRGSNWKNHLLWWVDREGRRLQLGAPVSASFVSLSPDGGRAAMVIMQPNNADIFLLDAATGERERFTFDAVWDETPVWSPDGRRIAYSAEWPGKTMRVYVKAVDPAAESVLLYTATQHLHLSSWSSDGIWLAFDELDPETADDIYVLQVDSVENVIPIAVTDADESGARFSPNGRWLAYQLDGEVFVMSFPPTGGQQQVSTDGGREPRWSAAGDELFFWKGDTLMAAKVSTQGLFRRETPRPLFALPDVEGYDVTADGQRFLVKVQNPNAPAAEIHVVLNWFEELKAKVGN